MRRGGIAISLKSAGRFVLRAVRAAQAVALGKAGRAQGKGIAKGVQRGAVGIFGRAKGMLLGMQGFGFARQFVSTGDEHGFILASNTRARQI